MASRSAKLGFIVFLLTAAGCSNDEAPLDSRIQALSRMAFLPAEEGPALLVDRFEVTREEFAAFVRASGYRGEGAGFLLDWASPDSAPQGLETHPVVFVSRRDAEAFAASRGMRLPLAEEWERLACGRSDPRSDPNFIGTSARVLYPWGNAWQSLYANTLEMGLGRAAPVGAFESGRSEIGCYDVAGNVWEWLGAGPDPSLGIAKGGAFDYGREKAQCYESLELDPQQRVHDLGFRCVGEFGPMLARTLAGWRPGGEDLAALLHCVRKWGAGCEPALAALAGDSRIDAELLRRMREAAATR